MIKVWITGASGQIGSAINEVADPLKYEIINTDVEELDVRDIDAVSAFAQMYRPDVIINCAAMTDVKTCEKDPKEAYRVNALGARNLAISAWKLDAVLVQISTDDVFDGKGKEPNKEFDMANPATLYGKSKLAGEIYAKEFTEKHFVIRSNWVYGKGVNFVKAVAERALKGETIFATDDQFGSPTSAKDLAKFILFIMETGRYGTYHATNKGVCSRYELAEETLSLLKIEGHLEKRKAHECEYENGRPHFAALDNFILSCENVYSFRGWQEALAEYISENY